MKKTLRLLALVLVMALSVCALASCAPASDPDKALAALQENGFLATKAGAGGYAGCVAVVSGTRIKEKNDELVVDVANIYYFESADAASDAWELLQRVANNDKKEDQSSWVLKKSGKMIYWGTRGGISSAR